MLALQLPASPIDYTSTATHTHHFYRPLGVSTPPPTTASTLHPTQQLPMLSAPRASRKPKLSLVITSETKRTFTRSSSLQPPRGPISAMSPTSRNTLANAKLGSNFSAPALDIDDVPEYSCSSSSSDTSEDAPTTPLDEKPFFSAKDKKRKRVRDAVVASPIELPRPQPKKRGLSPSERRVRFVEEPLVIEFCVEADQEAVTGTVMERMMELRKLKVEVAKMELDDNKDKAEEKEKAQEQQGADTKEGSGWMWKLGKMEYEQIAKMEESEAATTPVVGGSFFGRSI
ncbi:hypothetical protein RUND412_009082 [Rhizina undulata]